MTYGAGASESALVTGASGFIGSAVVRALVDDGYRVRALCEPGRSAQADEFADAIDDVLGDLERSLGLLLGVGRSRELPAIRAGR